MLFSRWGAFIYRFRKIVFVLAILLAAASLVLASKASSALSSGGWFDPTSESATVSQRLADEYDAGRATIVALFRGAPGADARSRVVPGGRSPTASTASPRTAGSTASIGYTQTHDDRFITTDGTIGLRRRRPRDHRRGSGRRDARAPRRSSTSRRISRSS